MIHHESTRRQWRHVKTCVRPADIVSKGAKGSELYKLELWLNGPWRHVETCASPADIASRGAKGSELHKLELWLNGPKFLWKEEENKHEQPSQLPELPLDNSECRKCPGRANVIVHGKMLERCCPTIHPGKS